MNWSEIQGHWEQLKVLLRTHWGRLRDEDFQRIDGKRERLAEVLRKRYGWERAEAERRIAAFEKDVRFPGAVK
jgi:uncharacterized protein YjbJ (UPF0337 family)